MTHWNAIDQLKVYAFAFWLSQPTNARPHVRLHVLVAVARSQLVRV